MNEKKEKLETIYKLLQAAETSINNAKQLLTEILGKPPKTKNILIERVNQTSSEIADKEEGVVEVIEGVFDGENMIAPDGRKFPVPPNYCSKSKLVEGDILKLRIMQDGSLVYKQISPIERKRVVGILAQEEPNKYKVITEDGKAYKVLLAAVTYFKAQPGDEVTLVVPKDKEAEWGAIEAVIPKK